MTELDDEMNEKAWAVIVRSGPWAVVAVILILFQLLKIDPAIATMQAQHDEMRAEDRASDLQTQNVMGQVLMAIERSNYLERRNCINTARTQADREACAKDKD